MADDLLHEIREALIYENNRDVESKARLFIRDFRAMVNEHILDELYFLAGDAINENQSSQGQIAVFRMIQTLIKRESQFD